jgi:glutathione synthase/RimK-type ligase-like ATP-grasp enzyme
MHIRVVPYKPGSESAKKLAERLSVWLKYKVWRGAPKLKACNLSWGSKETANVNWINSPAAIMKASNKHTTFDILKEKGISHVPYTVSKKDAQAWLEAGKTVFARTVSGQSGSGITIVHPEQTLPDMPLYTQYVKKRKEFRAHVVAGKVIDVQQKKRRNGSQADNWICNLANGWVFCHEGIVEPTGLRDLAVQSVACLGLDFGAVDIIWNEHYDQCFVLEVNTAPGLCDSTCERYANALAHFYG